MTLLELKYGIVRLYVMFVHSCFVENPLIDLQMMNPSFLSWLSQRGTHVVAISLHGSTEPSNINDPLLLASTTVTARLTSAVYC
jgi:hypothetical protein